MPNSVLWARPPHTRAKHEILRGIVEARLAIMGQGTVGFPELVLVDGFAGPGQYVAGELGSPLIMLDAFLEHASRAAIRARLRYVFIERHRGRCEHLRQLVAARTALLPPTVTVEIYNDPFDVRMSRLLGELGPKPPPVFVFVDPFGISDRHRAVTSRVLGQRGCEVLVYVPLYHIARLIDQPEFAPHLCNVFDGESWRVAADVASRSGRIEVLKSAFMTQMRRTCRAVRPFEIVNARGNSGYYLFFGTNHELGLLKGKEAMWRMDPVHGRRYRPRPVQVAQGVLDLTDRPDLAPLVDALAVQFQGDEFTVAQAERFTLWETDFLPTHLRKRVFAPLERAGELSVARPLGARSGTYPTGTRLCFVRSPSASAARAIVRGAAG